MADEKVSRPLPLFNAVDNAGGDERNRPPFVGR